MILSILSAKPKKDGKNNYNDKVTISTVKMMWNHKQTNIARASAWSTNIIMNKDC
jgi:hypothetical protein